MYCLVGIDSEGNQAYFDGDGFVEGISNALVYINASLTAMRAVKGRTQVNFTELEIQIAEVSRTSNLIENTVPLGFFLDAYPGASVFALDQAYTAFAGPFYEGTEQAVTRLLGTVYNAYTDFDVQITQDGAITSASEDGAFTSETSVTLPANRLVCAVLRVKSSTPDDAGRGLIMMDSENVFQIRQDNSIRVHAPRVDYVWQAVDANPGFNDDEFMLIAFLVQNGSLKIYLNGVLMVDQMVQSLAAANGPINVFLKGVDYKMLATWPDTSIPEDVAGCMSSIMNHYTIS